MARMVDGAARIRLALVITLSGTLALLVASMSAISVDSSSLVMLTAVAALVAAVVGSDRRVAILVVSQLAEPVLGTEKVPSFLAARVTDTAHHPVRPRAPGVV